MDKQFQDKMQKKLISEKERLEKELKEIEKNAQTTESEQSGELDYTESFADVGSTTFDREKDDSLAWNVKDLLNQINDSLQKIKEGTYGTCADCNEEIDHARLEAIPYASSCLTCRNK